MSQSCPLTFRLIDGTVVRIGAFYISMILIIFLITQQNFLLYFLLLDFIMRLYGYKPYSIVYNLSLVTKKIFSFSSQMSDAGAKRLAAHFGLFFIVLLTIEKGFELEFLEYVTVAAFLFCSILEILFSYCVGCKIYFFIKKIYPAFME
jgi:Domain of unknown function (DUF4395)